MPRDLYGMASRKPLSRASIEGGMVGEVLTGGGGSLIASEILTPPSGVPGLGRFVAFFKVSPSRNETIFLMKCVCSLLVTSLPYRKTGAWSKTMIGYGPEEQNFALELTYNYGIDGYKNGDDLQYICVQTDVAAAKAKAEAEGKSGIRVERARHRFITASMSTPFRAQYRLA